MGADTRAFQEHSDTSAALFTVAPLNSLSVPVVADKFAGKHFAKKRH